MMIVSNSLEGMMNLALGVGVNIELNIGFIILIFSVGNQHIRLKAVLNHTILLPMLILTISTTVMSY